MKKVKYVPPASAIPTSRESVHKVTEKAQADMSDMSRNDDKTVSEKISLRPCISTKDSADLSEASFAHDACKSYPTPAPGFDMDSPAFSDASSLSGVPDLSRGRRSVRRIMLQI